jgi:hypothetical protein
MSFKEDLGPRPVSSVAQAPYRWRARKARVLGWPFAEDQPRLPAEGARMTTSMSAAVLRASSGLILDQMRLGRGPLDFTDALILMAVTQANVEPVLRDAALNRAFAAYDRPPPDDLRRPISVNAVAQSLGIPFETVRRRVTRLSRIGVYRSTPAGVIVPGWVVRLGAHRSAAEANYRRVQDLYFRLAKLGALPAAPKIAPWAGPAPLRAVARVSAEYLLRLIATANAQLDDLGSAVVWLEVLRSTHEHLPDAAGVDRVQRRPVRVTAVARRLGMPFETVRRRVVDLAARGLCETTDRGVVLSPDTADSAEWATISDANHRDLTRMFASLGLLGVLTAWEAEAAAA